MHLVPLLAIGLADKHEVDATGAGVTGIGVRVMPVAHLRAVRDVRSLACLALYEARRPPSSRPETLCLSVPWSVPQRRWALKPGAQAAHAHVTAVRMRM